MLLVQCKLFYVKEFLIIDYSKAFCNAILVHFTRLCFKINNLTKLKLSWPVTLTSDPPAVISCPGPQIPVFRSSTTGLPCIAGISYSFSQSDKDFFAFQ